ncbi:MAG: bifunctional ADP-heptose synthase [Bacteroidetes bacterium]|nr:bifunctional ADP-heptose synthase [Bacteroidota bacterium]
MDRTLKNKLKNYLQNASNKTIAVIGDVMLDQYFIGNVMRISPEAPVPVVDITAESFHLGGAANVAQNLKSLGCNSILFGLLGDDINAERFIELCKEKDLNPDGLYKDANRITTIKSRIIGNGQQIVRMDSEITDSITKIAEDFIIKKLQSAEQLDAIIFEDYDKGTITKQLINRIILFAKANNIPTFVDPKFNNFSNYSGVTLFKPNKKETEAGLKIKLNSKESIIAAGNTIMKEYNISNVLITLGADGMILFEKDGITEISTIARKVADVSGAGDTTIATLTAMYVSGMSFAEASMVANVGAGIVCEKPGVVAIEQNDLIEGVKKYL